MCSDLPRGGLEQFFLTEILIVYILSVVLQILHVRPEGGGIPYSDHHYTNAHEN